MFERGAENVSWLTTCPHCRTTFRVGQEQLDAHGGDVRCGKCQHVFNAKLALKPEAVLKPEPVQEPEEIPPPPEEIVLSAEETPKPEPLPEEILLPREEIVLLLEEAAAEEPAPEFLIEEEIVLGEAPEEAAVAEPLPEVSSPPESVEQAFAPTAEEVSPEKPRRNLAWLWALGGLFLLLALAVQALYTFRVELAARSPAFKPLLVQLCAALQCQVGLPRHIETLGIEGSDLQADPLRPGVLILSAVLRSRADYSQQYPLLELTLTDTADKALVRRVFTPAEYLPKGKDPAAGMPGSGEAALKLNLQLTDLQPVGYRLYLFYPQYAAGDS